MSSVGTVQPVSIGSGAATRVSYAPAGSGNPYGFKGATTGQTISPNQDHSPGRIMGRRIGSGSTVNTTRATLESLLAEIIKNNSPEKAASLIARAITGQNDSGKGLSAEEIEQLYILINLLLEALS